MYCPKCDSNKVVPELSSGYAGYRCSECGTWSYSAHMKKSLKSAVKTMTELEHKIKDMVLSYGIEDDGIINDFLIAGKHLNEIVEMARELPDSEFV